MERKPFWSEDWSSLARRPNKLTFSWCWQSLVGKKPSWCIELIATFLISGAEHQGFVWQKTEIKSMPNICLSWAWSWPGLVLVKTWISCDFYPTFIYVEVRVIEISPVSPDVTISPSAGALSHFIVLVAQVFDCEYFSGIPLVSDLMRLFVQSCATSQYSLPEVTPHYKIHWLGRGEREG